MFVTPIAPHILELLDGIESLYEFPISYEPLLATLQKSLGITDISFEQRSGSWSSDLTAGLGSTPLSLSFHASPLHGNAFWIMPYEDARTLVSWITNKEGKPLLLENPEWIKEAYKLLITTTMNGLSHIEPFSKLSYKLTKETPLTETGYAIDIAIRRGEVRVWGRLVLDPAMKASAADLFSVETASLHQLAKAFPSLPVPLTLIHGTVECTKQELDSLQQGDFILLDSKHLQITLQDQPLFHVKIKEGICKVLDVMRTQEEVNV